MQEFDQEDRIISLFIKSLGPWGQHVVIGGGYALIIYKLYFADKIVKNSPVGTRVIDSLIPRKISKISKKTIFNYLQDAGFTQVFKDLDQPATESYLKVINGIEVEIEFLTDMSSRKDKQKNVVVSGIVAQPLNYLTLSLQSTLSFKTKSNVKGFVVSPGAWIFHKGLTFLKRKDALKIYKDLYGIWFLTTQLGQFSKKALSELLSLRVEYSSWFKTLQKKLDGWAENASPLDWTNLEAQDPSGQLKRVNFLKMMKEITS